MGCVLRIAALIAGKQNQTEIWEQAEIDREIAKLSDEGINEVVSK